MITSGNHSITLAFPRLRSHIPTLAAAFKGFAVPKVVPFRGWGHGQRLATASSPLPLASKMEETTNLSETTFMDNAWIVWPASVTSKIRNHKIIRLLNNIKGTKKKEENYKMLKAHICAHPQ